jgi:hypothetical protein
MAPSQRNLSSLHASNVSFYRSEQNKSRRTAFSFRPSGFFSSAMREASLLYRRVSLVPGSFRATPEWLFAAMTVVTAS